MVGERVKEEPCLLIFDINEEDDPTTCGCSTSFESLSISLILYGVVAWAADGDWLMLLIDAEEPRDRELP